MEATGELGHDDVTPEEGGVHMPGGFWAPVNLSYIHHLLVLVGFVKMHLKYGHSDICLEFLENLPSFCYFIQNYQKNYVCQKY